MTDNRSDAYADRESAIEETITDVVEHWWGNMTETDEEVDDMIETLAVEKLGLNPFEQVDAERYAELFDEIIRGAWMGLGIKVMSQLQERMMNDAKANIA